MLPNNLAFTPDGQYAFVTETFRPAPNGATQRSQIPPGQQLAVINVSNPQQPTVDHTNPNRPTLNMIHNVRVEQLTFGK